MLRLAPVQLGPVVDEAVAAVSATILPGRRNWRILPDIRRWRWWPMPARCATR